LNRLKILKIICLELDAIKNRCLILEKEKRSENETDKEAVRANDSSDNSEDEQIVIQTNPGPTCEMCQQLKAKCERIESMLNEERDEAEKICQELNKKIVSLNNDYQGLGTKNIELTAMLETATSDIERLTKGACFVFNFYTFVFYF
jgi:hypothetical protein